MKNCLYYGILRVIITVLFTSCSAILSKLENHPPPIEQGRNSQAILTKVQTTPRKKPNLLDLLLKKYKPKINAIFGLLWLWFLARFYGNEKRRRVSRWHVEDIALLKIIKDNSTRHWN